MFAVKVLQKQAICKRNEVKHIMSERNVLLKNVQHPFLVGLHYSFQTPDKLYFVLDYVNGGEVRMMIIRRHITLTYMYQIPKICILHGCVSDMIILRMKTKTKFLIFIAPAYSRVRYRSPNFCPSVRPFVRPSVNIYVEVKFSRHQ